MSDPNAPTEKPIKEDQEGGASSRPALLNIKSMPVNTALQFSTDVLDPVVFSQTFCRFQLAQKGFLHPNSQLTIQLEDNSGGKRAFPFTNVGLFSCIERAVLKTVDGRVLCSTEDLNHLQGLKSTIITNSANKEREQYKTGRQNAYSNLYTHASVTDASFIGLDNNKDYNTAEATGNTVENHLLNSNESIFSLSLHELFPYLKSGNQLPLYMMPTIQIELYWSPQTWVTTGTRSARMCAPGDSGETYPIIKANTQIFADYLFYSGDFMQEYKQKNNNMTFPYIDYRLARNSITVAQLSNAVRNVGGNGMVVTKVFYGVDNAVATADTKLLGPYVANGTSVLAEARNVQRSNLSTNLFYNNEFLFPQTVTNCATHFHHLINAEGVPCFLTRDAYSGEGGALGGVGAQTWETLVQQTEFAAKSFWQGTRLNKAERVNTKGIDLHIAGTFAADGTIRCWLEVMRFATLKDGQLEVFYV